MAAGDVCNAPAPTEGGLPCVLRESHVGPHSWEFEGQPGLAGAEPIEEAAPPAIAVAADEENLAAIEPGCTAAYQLEAGSERFVCELPALHEGRHSYLPAGSMPQDPLVGQGTVVQDPMDQAQPQPMAERCDVYTEGPPPEPCIFPAGHGYEHSFETEADEAERRRSFLDGEWGENVNIQDDRAQLFADQAALAEMLHRSRGQLAVAKAQWRMKRANVPGGSHPNKMQEEVIATRLAVDVLAELLNQVQAGKPIPEPKVVVALPEDGAKKEVVRGRG